MILRPVSMHKNLHNSSKLPVEIEFEHDKNYPEKPTSPTNMKRVDS